VTDANAAPGPDAGGNAGVTEHLVTTVLRSDAIILMLARQAVQEGDGSPAAHIAARRDLDREVREHLPWPSGEDYLRSASDYERMGRPDDAALLRRMAATDTLIAAAKAEWNTRYDARPTAPAAEMSDALRQAGIIDFDPGGPYMGVDGAAYEPGAFTISGRHEPILVITGRGTTELVTDWPGFDAMADWVASRGTTASGPLTPLPARRDCRAWEEDQILARLVTSPRDAPHLTAGLKPDTFTTDVRYDVYQAITAIAGRGGYYAPEQLEAELSTRIAAVPPVRPRQLRGSHRPVRARLPGPPRQHTGQRRGGGCRSIHPHPGRRAPPRAVGPGRSARAAAGAGHRRSPAPGGGDDGRAAAVAAPTATRPRCRRGAATVACRP
jgi:hypothetical protein